MSSGRRQNPFANQSQTKPAGSVSDWFKLPGFKDYKVTSETAMVALGNKMGINFSLYVDNCSPWKSMENSSEAPSFQGDDKTPASPSNPRIKYAGKKEKMSETTEFNSCHLITAAQIFQRINKTQFLKIPWSCGIQIHLGASAHAWPFNFQHHDLFNGNTSQDLSNQGQQPHKLPEWVYFITFQDHHPDSECYTGAFLNVLISFLKTLPPWKSQSLNAEFRR